MASTFEKLNLGIHRQIVVIDAPASFEPELAKLRGIDIRRHVKGLKTISFSLVFVTTQQEVNAHVAAIAPKANGDAIVWFAYPKGTSKQYKSEVSRDRGWDALVKLGFETVRAVAIDEDWSGLRFRRVEFVGNKRPAAKGPTAKGSTPTPQKAPTRKK